MTVKDYITQRFQAFGIQLSEAELYDVYIDAGINGEDIVAQSNFRAVSIAMTKLIPILLLRATSISESGFSKSWDVRGIKEFYAHLCKKYGLKDEINQKPQLTFL